MMQNSIKYHFWLGNKSGYVWACHKDYKLTPRLGERFKYAGYTYDIGWPKKMSTGRLLHKQSSGTWKKQRKYRKLCERSKN